MNLVSKIKSEAAALAIGFVLAATLTAVAQGGNSVPKGMSPQAYQALVARGQALNQAYHLGDSGASAAFRALTVRSQALDGKYQLGAVPTGTASDALNALRVRSNALNARYHLGRYTIIPQANGFDWTDAGIGAAGMLGVILVATGLVAGARRYRDMHEAPFSRTT